MHGSSGKFSSCKSSSNAADINKTRSYRTTLPSAILEPHLRSPGRKLLSSIFKNFKLEDADQKVDDSPPASSGSPVDHKLRGLFIPELISDLSGFVFKLPSPTSTAETDRSISLVTFPANFPM